MKKLKKIVSLTVVTAIMAASVNVSNVVAAENVVETAIVNETISTENSDFSIVCFFLL